MKLLDLPNEVIVTIIQQAANLSAEIKSALSPWPYPEYNYASLQPIALCCRQLYTLSLPLLWKDKVFILPGPDDLQRTTDASVTATDILATPARFHHVHLGEYVRSLHRQLSNSPVFDLHNSMSIAQQVTHLRALRIDFHPQTRMAHYGLCYFAQHCPHLNELYLSHCRDTFDDFRSLIDFRPPLSSLVLESCTLKQNTYIALFELYSTSLSRIKFDQVEMEEESRHLLWQRVTPFPSFRFSAEPMIRCSSLLTEFALTDLSLTTTQLQTLVLHAPFLQALSVMLHETAPSQACQALQAICSLTQIETLSIAFCESDTNGRRLPCPVPSMIWTFFATQFPQLHVLHIVSQHILVSTDFLPLLIQSSPFLSDVLIHHVGLVLDPCTSNSIEDNYFTECNQMISDLTSWPASQNEYVHTINELKVSGAAYFDHEMDQICLVKNFAFLLE
ncbi:hypothetical protein A0J61_09618 [Choanephora cucurbitarum]|uniref:F-box domain-containing protein n=2 Tax=Choanephora cucurbitarum TaxID=101091 RepID=A0A1C7MZW4_9FUNG|nr:hypothetical protein A0J61_09618 [Choanephora cucurbitarum]